MMTPYANRYQQTQVLTSSGAQIVVLLYDGAIRSIELARQGIEANNLKDKGRFLGRAISIVGELNSVLDYERGGEIARSLHRLYDYMLAELLQANLRNNPRHLDGPLKCLVTLREAWQTVAQQQNAMAATGK
jgi:flagellar protein FliS